MNFDDLLQAKDVTRGHLFPVFPHILQSYFSKVGFVGLLDRKQ